MPMLAQVAYLAASLCFIVGLKRLSSPATARSGNWLAAAGMTLAVIATLFAPGLGHAGLLVTALVIGVGLGVWGARAVQMTDMPQMVALLNGLGGGAAALVATAEFWSATHPSGYFDAIQKAGSLLGSAAIVVLDDTTCMVWLAENLLHFYRHESCGKCTPCREGTDWLHKILQRIERGEGQMRDLDLLASISGNVAGKTLCAFGDAAVTPVLTTLKHFRHEYEAHVREGRCTLPASWRAGQPVGAH